MKTAAQAAAPARWCEGIAGGVKALLGSGNVTVLAETAEHLRIAVSGRDFVSGIDTRRCAVCRAGFDERAGDFETCRGRIIVYHGIPLNWDLIVFFFGAIAWMIRGIAKAAKQVRQRTGVKPAPAEQTTTPQTQAIEPAARPSLQATSPLSDPAPVRERPRQPLAGGPAVARPATRRDFERREQELIAAEPASLGTLLQSGNASIAPASNGLFSDTDSLIRAIILQEVLGPPLSRRAHAPIPPPASPQ